MRRAVLAVFVAALTACGYSTGSLAPKGRRTIAVPVFENPTRRHDLQFELTRAVVEEIGSRTSLRVVSPSDSPDLVLKGSLVEVDEDVLSHADDQRIRESAYFLTAEIEVVDARTGDP